MRGLASLLLTWLAFLLGTSALLDAALPTKVQAMRVDGHDSYDDAQTMDTDYKLRLVGGNTGYCDVGLRAYRGVRDGDAVEVTTSALYKQCARITRSGAPVHERPYWRLHSLLAGIVLIGSALGWRAFQGNGAGNT